MKCHCGLECYSVNFAEEPLKPNYYWACKEHGFQGWVNTEGFEYLD